MNTTQNTRRVIAAALLAGSAGLALSSCGGQPHLTEPQSKPVSDAQVAQERAEYRDVAERRDGLGGPVAGHAYRDQAERRAGLGAPTAAGDAYPDLAERRLRLTGH